MLVPLMRKFNPRRSYISGQTYKGQTEFPPPWAHGHKDFNNPKKFPLEIDHKNEVEHDARTQNLGWVTKLDHIIKSRERSVQKRKQPRGPPTNATKHRF